jgi:hypothetical protein
MGLLIYLTPIVQSQPKIKSGIKYGLEFSKNSSVGPGSFQYEPGFSLGLYTGIPLLRNPGNMFLLVPEINFTKYFRYRIHHDFLYKYEHLLNRYVLDERFKFSYLELGLLPEFLYCISDDLMLALYVGLSVGIGSEFLSINKISCTTIDTLSGSYGSYPPFAEYNMGNGGHIARCINIGMSLYYNIFIFDLLYRSIYPRQSSEIDDFRSIYVQLGLGF